VRWRWLAFALLVGIAALLWTTRGDGDRARGTHRTAESTASDPTRSATDASEPALEGLVRDGGNQAPLAGVDVRLYQVGNRYLSLDHPYPDAGEQLASTRSGSDGSFAFPVPEDGDAWIVTAHLEDYLPDWGAFRRESPETLTIEIQSAPLSRFWVVGRDGRPLPGAWVEVVSWRRALGSQIERDTFAADADGRIELRIAADETLRFLAPGHQMRVVPRPSLASDPAHSTVVLDRLRSLAGRVLDGGGRPVEGAQIRWHLETLGTYDWQGPIKTGADGDFEISGIEEGTWNLEASLEGYPRRRLDAFAGDQGIKFVLERGARVSGVVRSASGEPMAVPVKAVPLLAIRTQQTKDSDREGRFEFSGLIPGPCVLMVDTRMEFGRHDILLAEGADLSGIELRLERLPRSWVVARILDKDGVPLHGSEVEAITTRGDVDKEGYFRAEVSRPIGDDWMLEVDAYDLTRHLELRTVAAATDPPKVFRLRPPVEVELRVRDEDGSALDPELEPMVFFESGAVWTDDEDPHLYRLQIDPDGDEEHSLVICVDGYRTQEISPWNPPPEGGAVTVRMDRGAAVTGRVVRASGEPLERVGVRWHPRRMYHGESCPTDAEGRFRLEALPRGEIVLEVFDSVYEPALAKRTVVVGHSVTEIGDFIVPPPRVLSGVVVDAQGQPIAGASVRGRRGSTSTWPDGSFRFEEPDWGEAHVRIWKRGYSVVVSESGAWKRVVLRPEARLEITPPKYVTYVYARTKSGLEVSPKWRSWNDRLHVWKLPAGEFVLELVVNGMERVEHVVMTVPGETVRLDLSGR
jgi:protocatechuate 3,4-dioxygenase beta subunit